MNVFLCRLGAGGGESQGLQQLAGGGCRSPAIRVSYQHPRSVARSLPSRWGSTRGSARGGAGRGAKGGAHHEFKGVRTRQGVKGYLVEIRPPKWKKTIWLGTYNTSVEAAGAYDAGTNTFTTFYSLHFPCFQIRGSSQTPDWPCALEGLIRLFFMHKMGHGNYDLL